MTTTIRVSDSTRHRVAALAHRTGRQMQNIVDDAVTAYEKALFWDEFEQGYERLADDAQAWSSIREERHGEQGALTDGL